MSIFSKVTLKTLWKNRVRTAVTIVGIILSAAMITAVTTSISSFLSYTRKVVLAQEGLWHGAFYNMPASDRERLEADGRLDSAAYAQVMGWYRQEDTEDSYFPYLLVLGGDETFYERMPVAVSEGRLPENPGEIILRQRMLGDRYIELGDTVTMGLGDRHYNGRLLDNTNGYAEGEELIIRDTRTYTVVGFFDRPQFELYSIPGQMCLTRWDDTAEVPYLETYFLLKDPGDTYDFQAEFPNGAYGSDDNSDYLMTLGLSRFDTFYTVIYGFAAILTGLIMFGSVSLIYNAFSISVAERTKQFGLLRSVGATKKQIRSMVFTEAMAVSAVGIPLGIISGILGMTVTFHFIGRPLASLFRPDGAGAVALTMRVSLGSVAAAAAIALVTVLISAWVPSKRAMRITAIEAIRQSGDIRIKPREVKTSPLTYKLFGLEGAIAGKYFKRNRKNYRATVVSLFMSVVLFISASSFCRYLTDSVNTVFEDYDYDISLNADRSTFAEHKDGYGAAGSEDMGGIASVLGNAESVTAWSAMKSLSAGYIFIPRSEIPEDRWNKVAGMSTQSSREEAGEGCSMNMHVYGVEENTYRAFLRENGLSEAEYMGEDPKVIVRATARVFNADTQRMDLFTFLSEDRKTIDITVEDDRAIEDLLSSEEYLSMSDEERQEAYEVRDFGVTTTYEIGCMLDELPLGLNGNWSRNAIVVLMPLDEAIRISENSRFDTWNVYFTTGDRERGLEKICLAAADAGLELTDGYFFRDVYDESASQRSLITVINVVSCGFIILISAIAAVNVFNTVSTNILLRRRDFAMLRSVGMTNRGFNRMMNFECLLYGTKSLLFGIPAAFGVTYLIFRTVQSAMDTDFYLPWPAVAIAVGSVFLVVFLSMMYSMAGIKRDNPIEAMKNEVI